MASVAAGWLTMRQSPADERLSAPNLTTVSEELGVPKQTVIVLDFIGACKNIDSPNIETTLMVM